MEIDATCTEALTYIGVAWTGFDDPESEYWSKLVRVYITIRCSS